VWAESDWVMRSFQAERGMQSNSNNGEWSKTYIEFEMNHILK